MYNFFIRIKTSLKYAHKHKNIYLRFIWYSPENPFTNFVDRSVKTFFERLTLLKLCSVTACDCPLHN